MRGACRGEFDAPTTTRECVDGILGEHLERPFDEHGIAVHLMTTAAVRDVDLDARGERRNACLEVACHAVDERSEERRVGKECRSRRWRETERICHEVSLRDGCAALS